MNSNLMAVALWSYALSALSHFLLAAFLLRRNVGGQPGTERDPVALTVLGAASLTVAWSVGSIFHILSRGTDPELMGVLDLLLYAGWYAVPLALMFFSPQRPAIVRRLLQLAGTMLGAGGISILMLALSPSAEWFRLGRYVTLGMAVFGLMLLEQMYRNAVEDSRWTIKPLVIGLGAVFLFDIYFFSKTLLFGNIDTTAFAVRGFAFALAVPLVTTTLLRPRFRKLKLSVSKNVVFHTTSLVFTGAYLLLASAAGYYVRYLGGNWGEALQLAVFFSAIVMLFLLAMSRTAQARLRVLVGKHFFSYRFDYREEWLRFTRTIINEDASRPLGQRVIQGLADMVESPAGALWMRDAQSRSFVQAARWNMPETAVAEPEGSALIEFLVDKSWVINLEEFRMRPGSYTGLEIPDWLRAQPNTWLLVPLRATTETIGFVVLATSRTPMDVNWEVNDLLKTAGSQAASYLAQMLATEALLEARKFEAFNKMSAFVVHDLKNIVSQLSLLVRNAERHAANPEFQKDMLLTVSHSVERMKQLMLQLREGATPVTGVRGVGLTNLVRRVHVAKCRVFPGLQLEILDDTLVTRGHEDRVERIIGHLVQNAIDATPADGMIQLQIKRDAGFAVVSVKDNGQGMSDEFLRNGLFKPFRTTKAEGMGIGAYESYQYVKELGGDIIVDSQLGKGTLFQVKLPLADGPRENEQGLGEA